MARLENVVRFRNERGIYSIVVDSPFYKQSDEKASAGDIVLTSENCDCCGFVKNDSFYKVLHVDSDGDYSIVDENNNICFIGEEDIVSVFKKVQSGCEEEKQEQQQPASTPKFKIGDKAVVIGDNNVLNPHYVKIGTVVTVTEPQDTEGRYGALEEGQRVNKWYTENDLRPATESDLKWAELGRRVGEFKYGDVVRVIRDNFGHRVGDIGVVSKIDRDGDVLVDVQGKVYWEIVELVAPVESVVNLVN